MRSYILRSQRTFAKQVAKEIVLEQARAEETLADLEELPVPQTTSVWRSFAMVASVVGLAVMGFLAIQFKAERDSSLERLQAMESSVISANAGELSGLEAALDNSVHEANRVSQAALSA